MVQELVCEVERAVQQVPPTTLGKAEGKNDEWMLADLAASINKETSCRTMPTESLPDNAVAQVDPVIVGQAMGLASRGGDYSPNNTHEETTFWVTDTLPNPTSSISTLLVPPIEIIPYLSSRPGCRPTFASKLFWATMSLGYRLASGAEKLQTAPRLLFYHLRFHTSVSIASRIGMMLLSESTGLTHEDTTPQFTYQMMQHIIRDLTLEGEDVKAYLDAREVELYFWRKGVDPISLGNLGVEDASGRLGELVQELSRNVVCFGDGPKYLLRDVEKAFLDTTGVMSMMPSLAFQRT